MLLLQWYKAEDVLCGEEIAYTLFTLAQVSCMSLLPNGVAWYVDPSAIS